MNLRQRRKVNRNNKKEIYIVSEIESTHDIDFICQRSYTYINRINQRTAELQTSHRLYSKYKINSKKVREYEAISPELIYWDNFKQCQCKGHPEKYLFFIIVEAII